MDEDAEWSMRPVKGMCMTGKTVLAVSLDFGRDEG